MVDVARQLDRHPASVTRWIVKGALLRDGSRRRLDALRTPGGWLIDQRDLDSFLTVLASDVLGQSTPVGLPAPVDSRAHDAADRELDAAGW